MTNFEYYTKNAFRLSGLLERVQNDALEADGCSYRLKMPCIEVEDRCIGWDEWLESECEIA